jgi:hypothetical protein
MKKAYLDHFYWINNIVISAVILFSSSILFPSFTVMGNNLLTILPSLLFTSMTLTILTWSIKPILTLAKLKLKGIPMIIFIQFFFIICIWVLSRYPNLTGFGISSFKVAIVLGTIIAITEKTFDSILNPKSYTGNKRRK